MAESPSGADNANQNVLRLCWIMAPGATKQRRHLFTVD
jgi:hypothetical protein